MLMKQYAWEFDPYGTNPNNYITGERHTLTPDSGKGFHFFIPKAAPFFLKDIEIVHVGTGRKLIEGVDWQPGWMFELATRRTYMPVYAAISILDKTLNGTFEIKYRTIGGEYTLDDATLLEYLSNVLTDPRVTTWEAIVEKPLFFAPLEHRFNIDQLVGMEDAIEALDRIRDAILQSINALYPSFNVHLSDKSNPHAVTKAQVGLGSVQNYPMATDEEAAAGTARNRMMSPAATKALVATLSSETVAGHASNTSNPHQVTKAQVGLGNVDNFKTATLSEALQGTATNLFITVQGAAELVKKLAVGDFTTHIEDKNNPHATTKTHVGLGNVDNFRTASNAEADAGSSTTTFTTVAIVKRMLDRFIITPFNSHINNRANPHAVTKAQVGLSDVENYPVANEAELLEGTASNRYTSVLGVKKMIDKFGITGLDAHLNDKANPHGVTKAQVGLSNVENFAVANDTALDTGTASNLYVTVAGVKKMIERFANLLLTAHINDKANPHETTKAQVGLGSVDNFATASDSEADIGTANNRFTTVAIVKRMIQRFGVTGLDAHLNDKANPHGVTKAQVGLGNVENFAVANDVELAAGTASNLYTTVSGVKKMIERFANYLLTTHINDKANPHETTKAQVGLSNVENFAVANDTALDTGTANNLYVTVAGVARMIAGLVGGSITDHVNNRNNPHGTTKDHVGLGNVDNFATASSAEADAGVANDKFGTISLIKRMIDRFAVGPLTTHTDDRNNPHAVTKAQVGLGSVNNYATASDAQAKAGTATNLHITPANLKSVFDDKLPGLGIGKVVTHFVLPANVTGGVGWYAIAQQLQEDTSAGRYMLYGLTNNNRPVEVVVRYDQTTPLVVIEETGAVLQAQLGTTYDATNGIVKLWVNPNPQVGEVLAVKLGGGGAFLLEGWRTAAPAGISYVTANSAMLLARLDQMWSDFYMAETFATAADSLENLLVSKVTEIKLAGVVTDLTDDQKRLFRWSTTLNVAAGASNRMEIGGVEVHGGAIRVSLNGTIKLNETIERPTTYLGYVDLLPGSNAVIVEVECSLFVQPPSFVEAVIEQQNVKLAA